MLGTMYATPSRINLGFSSIQGVPTLTTEQKLGENVRNVEHYQYSASTFFPVPPWTNSHFQPE
jgi:hypothetical protein